MFCCDAVPYISYMAKGFLTWLNRLKINLSGEEKRAGHYFYGFGAPLCLTS